MIVLPMLLSHNHDYYHASIAHHRRLAHTGADDQELATEQRPQIHGALPWVASTRNVGHGPSPVTELLKHCD